MNKSFVFLCLFLFTALLAQAQTPAFPTAEGYGKFAKGGRGGQVVAVTNTEDYLSTETPIEGSFRWALTQYPGQPLTVVFRTSGLITLKADIRCSNTVGLTIAGQTAPGDGICLRGAKVNLGGSKNLVLRHLRMRVGLKGDTAFIAGGSLGIENSSNFIVDHCTFGWSAEENTTIYDNTLTTFQWCILHEGLYCAGHGKGVRSYGCQWGGQSATYHHNLLANNMNRTPRFNGARSNDANVLIDYVNNVNFNWGKANSAYGADIELQTNRCNMIGNYYKPGPARPGTSSSYFVQSSFYATQTTQIALWYMNGNFMEGSANTAKNTDNYLGLDASQYVAKGVSASALKSETMFPVPYPVNTETAAQAYQSVLAKAGAFPRDTVDRRIVNEVRTGIVSGKSTVPTYLSTTGVVTTNTLYGKQLGIIDNPLAVGGYPEYKTYNSIVDIDNDGMDDAWEVANGLNPTDAADRNLLTPEGYTALEVYLNSLVGEFIDHDFAAMGVSNISTNRISISPSVATDELIVISDDQLKSAVIYSINGTRLSTVSLAENATINVSQLATGCYIVQVAAQNNVTKRFKFIKK